MRSGGYKCYNYQCDGRVGDSTLCGELGNAALYCVNRMVSQQTNADRIRAMSDEELARFLTWNVPDCINFCNDARCGCKWNCKHGEGLHFITNWLRQPAVGGQHD